MIDISPGICCCDVVKFLPRPSSLLLLTVALSLSACATAANRRALYFPAKPGGVWHDYETRRYAEAQTGISTAAYTSTTTTVAPVTPMPVSRPVRTTTETTTSGATVGTTPAESGLPSVPGATPAADAPAPVVPTP